MQVLDYKTLKHNVKAVLNSVTEDYDTVIVNRGKSNVVIISLEEYNSWKETESLFSSKANAKRLRKSIKEVEKKRSN
ncbi:MAG: antitoxin YefM [Halioglobus sp.]